MRNNDALSGFSSVRNEDFEFGSPDNVNKLDHLNIDWWLILEAIAFYVVYAFIGYVISLLLFAHNDEPRTLLFAAYSLVCSIPGAWYLSRRVKNRRFAHGVYYSIVPMAVMTAQPSVLSLGPFVATMLILATLCLTMSIVMMNALRLLMIQQPLDVTGPPDPVSALYQGLEMPGDVVASIRHKTTYLSDLNNPYLELAVSDDLVVSNRSLEIAWISILVAIGLYFLVYFGCAYAFSYVSFRTLFEATNRNTSVMFAIVFCMRVLPWIVAATFLGFKLRKNWLWNAMLFVLITDTINIGLMGWISHLDAKRFLIWMLEDAIAVILTYGAVRGLVRICRSVKKAVWFKS